MQADYKKKLAAIDRARAHCRGSNWSPGSETGVFNRAALVVGAFGEMSKDLKDHQGHC